MYYSRCVLLNVCFSNQQETQWDFNYICVLDFVTVLSVANSWEVRPFTECFQPPGKSRLAQTSAGS